MRTVWGRLIFILVVTILALGTAGAAHQVPLDSRGFELAEEARQAYKAGRFDEAVRLSDKALEVEPEEVNALLVRGVALLQLGRPADAEPSLRKAAEIEGELAQSHAALGEALLALDRAAEAEKEFARALEIDPALGGTRLNLAVALWRRQAYADAEAELSRLETARQATVDSRVLHGQVLEKLGRPTDAAAAYGRALELDPKHPDALEFRQRLSAASGDAAAVLADLEARVAADPKDLAARRALADAYARAGRSGDAAKQVEAIGALAPDDPATYDLAGDLVVETAPLDAARQYVRAVRLAPENVEFRIKLGAALVRAAKYDAALEHLAFAVAQSPDRREAHAGLAATFYGLNRYEDAAREFGWLAEREPDSAFVQFFLGASLDRIGDCAGALAAFERFLAKADAERDKGRVDEVNLVVPRLRRQIDKGDCAKKSKKGE